MPYTIGWYIESEIIYIHYTGETTIDELRESLLETVQLINNSSRQLVHVISDVGDVTKPVSPKNSLELIREIGPNDRSGWNIILREKSYMIKLGVAFGTSVFKSRTRTFDTLEEITEFLKQMDDTLSWDKVNDSIIVR